MSLAVSGLSASGTPFITVQGSTAPPPAVVAHARYFAPVMVLPIVAPTVLLGLSLAITRARGVIVPAYTNADGSTSSVYLAEQARSRSLQSTTSGMTLTRQFYIHGSSDPATVYNIGPQVGDYDDVLTAFFVTDRKAVPYATGGGEADIVLLTITYSLPGPSSSSTTQATLSYDFGSESEHVDTALLQEHYTSDVLRSGNLINVTDDAVQGVDINAPILELSEEHYFKQTDFSPSFRRMLRDCLQKTNQNAFREWAAGEVLFTGASARKQGTQWFVTFQFRVRRNASAIPFTIYKSDGSSTDFEVNKLGWDYLWIDSIHILQAGKTVTSIVPHGVHVARVYDEIDFAVLGIGTDPIP